MVTFDHTRPQSTGSAGISEDLGARAGAPAASRLHSWIQEVGLAHMVPAGTTLFVQGAVCQQILWIEEGEVLLLRSEGTGVDVAVGIRGAGAILGAGAALSHARHPMTAVARRPVSVRTIVLATLEHALRQDDVLHRLFLRELGAETVAYVARCGVLGCLDARERLERLLLELANAALSGGRIGAVRIPLPVGELAGLLGVDVSHASRLLRALKREGLIEVSRGWIVLPAVERLSWHLPVRDWHIPLT